MVRKITAIKIPITVIRDLITAIFGRKRGQATFFLIAGIVW